MKRSVNNMVQMSYGQSSLLKEECMRTDASTSPILRFSDCNVVDEWRAAYQKEVEERPILSFKLYLSVVELYE